MKTSLRQRHRSASRSAFPVDPASSPTARTLAIDIGGTGLKACVLDAHGEMVSERLRVATPSPCPPSVLVEALTALVSGLPAYDRVSVGFPGVVRRGKIITAHNLGGDIWKGFDLDLALTEALEKPVRVLNDADIQGLGAISGHGVEMVITLGTGLGSSLFEEGRSFAHLELAHHPFRKKETYEEQLGDAALEHAGRHKWNRRVVRAIKTLRILTNFDHLYLGGGNASKVTADLPPDVTIVSNDLGLRGGLWLWQERTPGSTEIYRATDH